MELRFFFFLPFLIRLIIFHRDANGSTVKIGELAWKNASSFSRRPAITAELFLESCCNFGSISCNRVEVLFEVNHFPTSRSENMASEGFRAETGKKKMYKTAAHCIPTRASNQLFKIFDVYRIIFIRYVYAMYDATENRFRQRSVLFRVPRRSRFFSLPRRRKTTGSSF